MDCAKASLILLVSRMTSSVVSFSFVCGIVVNLQAIPPACKGPADHTRNSPRFCEGPSRYPTPITICRESAAGDGGYDARIGRCCQSRRAEHTKQKREEVAQSGSIPPLQGWIKMMRGVLPRALPWAFIVRPCGAGFGRRQCPATWVMFQPQHNTPTQYQSGTVFHTSRAWQAGHSLARPFSRVEHWGHLGRLSMPKAAKTPRGPKKRPRKQPVT